MSSPADAPSNDMDSDINRSSTVFLQWARKRLLPLVTHGPGMSPDHFDQLDEVIGKARVVALSEAVHGGAEALQFRNWLFEYLVREHGFTTIAIESGMVESRTVHDYVRGGPGKTREVLRDGFSWTFDQYRPNEALIHWLREYNADSRHTQKISFYGFDLPGSPGNPQASRGLDTALTEALRYLRKVDSTSADRFDSQLGLLAAHIRFDPYRKSDAPGYDRLSESERDTLSAIISDLISLMEVSEADYTALSSSVDYFWGYRAAMGARQADAWLRHLPLNWQPVRDCAAFLREQPRFLAAAGAVRDRAQADNLQSILDREGSTAKVLVFASRYHLSTAAVKAHRTDSWEHQVMGTYLRRRLGTQLLTIGTLIGGGHDSLEALAGRLGASRFLLDIRTAPPIVADWLKREHALGTHLDADLLEELRVPIGKAFDALFYHATMTSAV
jgi:erythromycin esterase